jgi:hypothetical protein
MPRSFNIMANNIPSNIQYIDYQYIQGRIPRRPRPLSIQALCGFDTSGKGARRTVNRIGECPDFWDD